MTTRVARVDRALHTWRRFEASRALRAVDPDRARAEAETAPDGILGGLVCSIKDVLPVAGIESCGGSLVLRGNIPVEESPLVAAARDSGAVVLGKGVCAEFAFGIDTENRLDGRVTNPLDPGISPGGSSGGDAVAVATGIVDFAIAGDYGGSVRWPAQAVGVLGLRLGVGRTPARHQIGAPSRGQQAQLDVPGVLARDPDVLERVVSALALSAPQPERTRRILVLAPQALGAVTREVVQAMADTVARLESLGYQLHHAEASLGDLLARAAEVYAERRRLTDTHDGVRALVADRTDWLCPSTVAVLDAAASPNVDAGEVERGDAEASVIAAQVAEVLRDVDALLLPVAASRAIPFAGTAEVGGARLSGVTLHRHLRAISLTGLPALSLPVGHALSVQLVGAPGAEQVLCRLARDLRGAVAA